MSPKGSPEVEGDGEGDAKNMNNEDATHMFLP